jgi:hypothetical protein
MNKNNIRENFNLSYFSNSITGSFDPTAKDPNDPKYIPTPSAAKPRPASGGTCTIDSLTGTKGYYQDDGTCGKDPPPAPPPPPDPKIYANFTLRLNKYPVDSSGKPVFITNYDPDSKTDKPITIYQSPDTNGTFNETSFTTSLNGALSECIKRGDDCYAVIIPEADDPSMPASSTGTMYTFQLVKKPPAKNASADSEYMICNQNYATYLKNISNGRSNIMPNTVSCDFKSSAPISLGSNIKKSDASKPSSSDSSFDYLNAGKSTKKESLPWGLIIGVVLAVLIIGGGIYYYYTQVVPANALPLTPSTKVLKSKGGYFFYV